MDPTIWASVEGKTKLKHIVEQTIYITSQETKMKKRPDGVPFKGTPTRSQGPSTRPHLSEALSSSKAFIHGRLEDIHPNHSTPNGTESAKLALGKQCPVIAVY